MGIGERLVRWCRRKPALASVSAALLVALIAGVGAVAWQAVRATLAEGDAFRERDRAEREKLRAQENFKLARDAVDRYFTKVSESPSMRAYGLENLRKELLLQAKDFYERFIQEQPEETGLQADLGKAYRRLGNISSVLGETAAAESSYAKAIAICEELSRSEPEKPEFRQSLAQAQRDLGGLFRDTSRPEKAQSLLEQAVAITTTLAAGPGNEAEYRHESALSYKALGDLRRLAHQLQSGEEAYKQAIAIEERLLLEHADEGGKYRSVLASSAGRLAELYRLGSLHKKAEASFQRAAQIYEKLSHEFPNEGDYQHDLAIAYQGLGSVHQDAAEPQRADAPLQQAVAIATQLVREHPDVLDYVILLASSYSRLARLENNLGKPHAVLVWTDKGIATLQRVIDKEPRQSQARRELNDLWIGRAVALAQTGDYDRAMKAADEVAKQEESTPVDVYNLACVYSRFSEAAGKDAKLSATDRAKLKEQYAGLAMDSLRRALAKGFKAVLSIKTEVDFDSLRDRDDFKKLLQELDGKK